MEIELTKQENKEVMEIKDAKEIEFSFWKMAIKKESDGNRCWNKWCFFITDETGTDVYPINEIEKLVIKK